MVDNRKNERVSPNYWLKEVFPFNNMSYLTSRKDTLPIHNICAVNL